jgi:hypothetical protein
MSTEPVLCTASAAGFRLSLRHARLDAQQPSRAQIAEGRDGIQDRDTGHGIAQRFAAVAGLQTVAHDAYQE